MWFRLPLNNRFQSVMKGSLTFAERGLWGTKVRGKMLISNQTT